MIALSQRLASPPLRSRAREVKFVISPAVAAEVEEWARRVMPADSHLKSGTDGHYQVTSLYFDNPDWAVFQGRGSYRRSKYRIRRYGDERVVFLERKIKTCGEISKWRSPVPLEELLYLSNSPRHKWDGDWFRRRIRLRGLQPVCRISYRRLARESQGRFGRFRLTLDHSIRAQTLQSPLFSGGSSSCGEIDCCPDELILELKFDQSMPALFKGLVEDFRLGESSFSKYRSAVEKLGLAPHLTSGHA